MFHIVYCNGTVQQFIMNDEYNIHCMLSHYKLSWELFCGGYKKYKTTSFKDKKL